MRVSGLIHLLAGALIGALVAAGVFYLLVPEGSDSVTRQRDGGAAGLSVPVVQPPDGGALTPRRGDLTASGAKAAAAGTEACAAEAPEGVLCAHGVEPPPPGVDTHQLPTVAQLRARRFGHVPSGRGRDGSAGGSQPGRPGSADQDSQVVTPEEVATTGALPCVGDGGDGLRVQAIYAHGQDRPNRYTDVLPLISQYAADVSNRINNTAAAGDRGLVVRYLTTGSPCVLKVDNVTLSASGDDSFAASVKELRAKGYNRHDRKYLVWVDAAVGICGVGHIYTDDKASLDNLNTRGDMFARVDAPCWGYAELHELLHTFGAVQDSAPQSTKAGHCVDETDTMCYSDTSGATMSEVCTSAPAWNVDCRLDDYFNADPPPGSYLAQHWNTARNPYLASVDPPPAPPTVSVSSASSAFAGNAWTVRAEVTVPDGRGVSQVWWTTSRTDCTFVNPTAPTTTYYCPVTAAGTGQVTAWVRDSANLEANATSSYTLAVPPSRRNTALTLSSDATRITRGTGTALRGRLTDSATGKAIIGMPTALYRRPAGQTGWEKIATRSTSPNGTITFAVAPAKTTDYQFGSGYTTTWATANSPIRRIKVTP